MKKIYDFDLILMNIYENAPRLEISQDSKIIIFSDLHIGDGGRSDDFKYNSELFSQILKEYNSQSYTLVLNGDVEELQKDRYSRIVRRWPNIFNIFDDFASDNRLFKIVGNHDNWLMNILHRTPYALHDGLVLTGYKYPFFIYHGHQSSPNYNRYSRVMAIFIKIFAGPLGIRNFTRLYHNPRKLAVETSTYKFSTEHKIISVIGHTHRPLFESLSRSDMLRFKIEMNIRRYRNASRKKREEIVKKIENYKSQLKAWRRHTSGQDAKGLLYSTDIAVPLLFNSGSVIGKKGFSGIEISNGNIYLISWRYINPKDHSEGFRKVVLRKDSLEYVMDCISILI
ncbi:MAG: metallophosphoesterase [Spirochaetales bacterium]|nr:metallophosphoesterase [Spirochaetales bacterium]